MLGWRVTPWWNIWPLLINMYEVFGVCIPHFPPSPLTLWLSCAACPAGDLSTYLHFILYIVDVHVKDTK